MQIKSAKFVAGSTAISQFPKAFFPEYAFIGRSNVGKSSLINLVTENKKLAKTSSTPGKTREINHFLINDNTFFTDLPGYGYAKVSKEKKKLFDKIIVDYFHVRENLVCVFVLIDSRIPLQDNDMDFMDWLGENEIPFVIVFTKTDKLSKNKLFRNIQAIKNKILETWEELPQVFYTSSVTKNGKEELLKFVEGTNKVFNAREIG